jgi:hypothetical protein
VKKFNKTYANGAETNRRYKLFQSNLRSIEKYNKLSRHARFGVNKFSDLSKEEYESQWLMQKIKAKGLATSCLANGVDAPQYSEKRNSSCS